MGMTYKEASRVDWRRSDGANPSVEQIQLGALQRIADASEKMAASYDQMRESRDYWERRAKASEAREQRLAHRIRALRGVITRMKKKIIDREIIRG